MTRAWTVAAIAAAAIGAGLTAGAASASAASATSATSWHFEATVDQSTILQLGTIQLRGGTLAVQGVQTENQQTAQLAVTGGTGSYTGAAGTVQVGGDGSVTINLAKP